MSRPHADCYNAAGIHKRAYAAKHDAKVAAKQTQSRAGGVTLNAYKGDCGYWHLGSVDHHRTLEFNCDRDLADWVAHEASRQGVSMGEIIRQALNLARGTTC